MTRVLPWLEPGLTNKPRVASSIRDRVDRGHTTPDRSIADETKTDSIQLSNDLEPTDATDLALIKDKTSLGNHVAAISSSPPAVTLGKESDEVPTYSPLRIGHRYDDGWIMVEDELLATAQQFTKHLHQEEYQRQRSLAKQRRGQPIVRPIDGRTARSADATLKAKQDRVERDIDRGVAEILNSKARKRKTSGDLATEDDDGGTDDWQGTSLQQYIGVRKDFGNLVGLQAVTSHTRAAAGYNAARKRKGFAPSDKEGILLVETKEQAMCVSDVESDDTNDDDDDDLDRPMHTMEVQTKRENVPENFVPSAATLKWKKGRTIKSEALAEEACNIPMFLP